MPYTSGRELDREQLADALEDLAEGMREGGIGIKSTSERTGTGHGEYTESTLTITFSTKDKYRHLHNALQFSESGSERKDE